MTDLRFQIFKIHPVDYSANSSSSTSEFMISKFESSVFDSFNVNLGSPVSPMPLPEDSAESNLLVKMEGNTKQVRFSVRFDKELVTIYRGEPKPLAKFIDVEDGFDPDNDKDGVYPYVNVNPSNNLKLLNVFMSEFENKSMTDSYLFRIYDAAASEEVFTGYGTITSVDASIDSNSPVVWGLNIDFLIGDVISIYDADTPDEPNNVTMSTPAAGEIKFDWTVPSRAGGSAITKYKIAYKSLSSTNYTRVEVAHTLFTKTVTGLVSGEYYSCYVNAINTGGTGTHSDSVTVKVA